MDGGIYISHRSMFIMPDLKVCGQLGFPMLNDVVEATPMREKPSPDTAQWDQTMQMRREEHRRRII